MKAVGPSTAREPTAAMATRSAAQFRALTAKAAPMVSLGRQFMPDWWWYATFPGLAIFLAVFGFNMLGDGVRDAFDPRAKVHVER